MKKSIPIHIVWAPEYFALELGSYLTDNALIGTYEKKTVEGLFASRTKKWQEVFLVSVNEVKSSLESFLYNPRLSNLRYWKKDAPNSLIVRI